MFDSPRPKYIEFYTGRVVGAIAAFSFLLWASVVDLVLFSIFNSSAYHPATTNELISYVGVLLVSALSQLIAAIIIMKSRGKVAELVSPLISTPLVGGLLFWALFLIYVVVFGLS